MCGSQLSLRARARLCHARAALLCLRLNKLLLREFLPREFSPNRGAGKGQFRGVDSSRLLLSGGELPLQRGLLPREVSLRESGVSEL